MDKKKTILEGILSYLEFVLGEEKASQGELQYVNNVGDMLDLLKKEYTKKLGLPTEEEIERAIPCIKEESICKYSVVFNEYLIQGELTFITLVMG